MREKYVLADSEIETLIRGLIENGQDNMYELMKGKVASMALSSDVIDLILMDMHDTILDLGRAVADDTPDSVQVKSIYYTLASMLRKLSQDLYISYTKAGKPREDIRFLRLVSSNKDFLSTFNPRG